jgi:hypothetical protein
VTGVVSVMEKTAPRPTRPRPWMRGRGAGAGWFREGMVVESNRPQTDRRPGQNRPAAMSLIMIFREGD